MTLCWFALLLAAAIVVFVLIQLLIHRLSGGIRQNIPALPYNAKGD